MSEDCHDLAHDLAFWRDIAHGELARMERLYVTREEFKDLVGYEASYDSYACTVYDAVHTQGIEYVFIEGANARIGIAELERLFGL